MKIRDFCIYALILFLLPFELNFTFAQKQIDIGTEITQINETPPSNECVPNLGDACSNQKECRSCYNYITFCLWCPKDTIMRIQVDVDPYYANLTNKTTFITKSGGEQGYCGYAHTTKCIGNWNGDEYYIDYYFLTDRTCESGRCIGPEEKLPLVKFLTKDILDFWKKEILKTISENYFKQHFDIESIRGYVQIDPNGNYKFEARIYYKFKYDWATTSVANGSDTWDRLIIAEKKNGVWKKLSEDEISSYYQQELERWRSLGKIKITQQEINSIISKQEALSKLKSCNNEMKIDQITIFSKNNTLFFIASGKVEVDTENCATNPKNNYTVILASVNLITGELTCTSYKVPCAFYAIKKSIEKRSLTEQNLIPYIGISILTIISVIIIISIKKKD